MFICPICDRLFQDKPIVLSCCNATVCESHVENDLTFADNNKRKFFKCNLCETLHEMNTKKFASNKIADGLFKLDLEKYVNLVESYECTRKEIQNLEISHNKMISLLREPAKFISEQISNVKKEMAARREKLMVKIDKIFSEMIQKLDNYQKECWNNIEIKKKRLTEETKELISEIQSKLNMWQSKRNHVVLVSEDVKRIEIQFEAKGLRKKLDELQMDIENSLLMGKSWMYVENDRVIEELKKELIQFEA